MSPARRQKKAQHWRIQRQRHESTLRERIQRSDWAAILMVGAFWNTDRRPSAAVLRWASRSKQLRVNHHRTYSSR